MAKHKVSSKVVVTMWRKGRQYDGRYFKELLLKTAWGKPKI